MEEKPYVQQKDFKKDFPFEKKENSYFRSQVFQKKISYKIIFIVLIDSFLALINYKRSIIYKKIIMEENPYTKRV